MDNNRQNPIFLSTFLRILIFTYFNTDELFFKVAAINKQTRKFLLRN